MGYKVPRMGYKVPRMGYKVPRMGYKGLELDSGWVEASASLSPHDACQLQTATFLHSLACRIGHVHDGADGKSTLVIRKRL